MTYRNQNKPRTEDQNSYKKPMLLDPKKTDFDKLEFTSEDEAIDSIDRLLQVRDRLLSHIQKQTQLTTQELGKAVSIMVDKGMVKVNEIKEVNGKYDSQLTINF